MKQEPLKVLAMGTWDILHPGHLDFLYQCTRIGTVYVGVNTDDFVATFKPRPVMSQAERLHWLESAGYKNVLYNTSPGKQLIEFVRPDVVATGTDWARKDYLSQIGVTQDWLDDHHVSVIYIPYVQNSPISSTEIKRRIREA